MKFPLAMKWKCQSISHCLNCNWMEQYASLFVCRRAETTLLICLCRTSLCLLSWNSWLTKSYAILICFFSINFLQHLMAFYRVSLSFQSNAGQYLSNRLSPPPKSLCICCVWPSSCLIRCYVDLYLNSFVNP